MLLSVGNQYFSFAVRNIWMSWDFFNLCTINGNFSWWLQGRNQSNSKSPRWSQALDRRFLRVDVWNETHQVAHDIWLFDLPVQHQFLAQFCNNTESASTKSIFIRFSVFLAKAGLDAVSAGLKSGFGERCKLISSDSRLSSWDWYFLRKSFLFSFRKDSIKYGDAAHNQK